MSTPLVEKSARAIPLLRAILHELKASNGDSKLVEKGNAFLMEQMRDHKLTQKILNKAPHEAEHLASCYSTYLNSTRLLRQLQEKYAGGEERTTEQTANLVGLTTNNKDERERC